MADDFQPGGSCGGSWWSVARTGGFDGLAASVSCSTTIADVGTAGSGGCTGYGWAASELPDGKAVSGDEPVVSCFGSGSSIGFQDTQKVSVSDPMAGGGSLLDSTLQMASFGLVSPTIDWNQTLLRSSGRAEPSFDAMLQESNQGHADTEDYATIPFKDMNQGFIADQHHMTSGSEIDTGFPLIPASYGSPSTLLQGLLEPNNKQQQSLYENRSVGYQSPSAYRGASSELSQPLWARFPYLFKGSPPKQPAANQFQFSNNTAFWNASAGAVTELRSNFYPPAPAQFSSQHFDQKPIMSNLPVKSNKEGARDPSSGAKKSAGETVFKKPRIETPSPLPTFKVRKEKLGDRITALQQLVSPFGKTDTASVLHEAIEYIKFLHEQVGALSTPYLKNGHPMQQQQSSDKSKDGEGPKQDLRSRGLCLVPVASTFPVASETTADFWTPTPYGGTYR